MSSRHGELEQVQILGFETPSFSSAMINCLGLDNAYLERIRETPGPKKLGKYIPLTSDFVLD